MSFTFWRRDEDSTNAPPDLGVDAAFASSRARRRPRPDVSRVSPRNSRPFRLFLRGESRMLTWTRGARPTRPPSSAPAAAASSSSAFFASRVLDALVHGLREVLQRGPVKHLVEPEHHLERAVHGVHGVLAQAVRQARADDPLDVLLRHLLATLVRHERLRGARHDDVAAQAVDVHDGAPPEILSAKSRSAVISGSSARRGNFRAGSSVSSLQDSANASGPPRTPCGSSPAAHAARGRRWWRCCTPCRSGRAAAGAARPPPGCPSRS